MEVPKWAAQDETARDCRQSIDRLLELRLSHWAHKSLLALWLRGYDRKLQDLSASDLTSWIGAGKVDRAHEAIAELKELLALGYSDRQRGRYVGVWIVDLRSAGEDSDGPRRHSCHREGVAEIPGEDWDTYRNPQAQTERPVETLSMSRAADVPRGVDSNSQSVSSPSSRSGTSPPSADFGPNSGSKIGKTATTTSTSTSRSDLSDTSTPRSTRRSNYTAGSEVEVRTDSIPGIGANFGNHLLAAIERIAERPSLLSVAGLTAEFPADGEENQRRWAEAAAIAIAEATSGGRGFGIDELAECIDATKTKRAAGTLTGPAWAFCRGAIQRKYGRLGIPWPAFRRKPR